MRVTRKGSESLGIIQEKGKLGYQKKPGMDTGMTETVLGEVRRT